MDTINFLHIFSGKKVKVKSFKNPVWPLTYITHPESLPHPIKYKNVLFRCSAHKGFYGNATTGRHCYCKLP
jgi:hypothetical protein